MSALYDTVLHEATPRRMVDGEVWVAAVLWLATRQLISLITDTNIMMMVVLVMDCVQ